MAETAESAAKKSREADAKIQETTTELRALEQAPAKAGGKEASSSLHVTLTEVAGDAPSSDHDVSRDLANRLHDTTLSFTVTVVTGLRQDTPPH